MSKIFTFGDGYATGHIWPEWPQILQALLPNYQVINNAGIGAGPEWLVNQFVKEIPNIANATVIFQWPNANRFDKLIEDSHWLNIADTDPIYNFNQHDSWWLSSASKQGPVVEYHRKFVQSKQHTSRLNTYKILVEQALKNNGCKYVFISTSDQDAFSQEARFNNIRQQEVQPSPPVHLAYINDVILPQLPGITVDVFEYLKLANKIIQHKWVAYDPDREEIWTKMTQS